MGVNVEIMCDECGEGLDNYSSLICKACLHKLLDELEEYKERVRGLEDELSTMY